MKLLSRILHTTHCAHWSGEEISSFNPATGKELGRVRLAEEEDYDDVLWDAVKTFERWRLEPAPKRGEIVREIGEELRAAKDELGLLVTLEMGKILAEGRGEVQEMIDIATFAAGLSRQLYGLTMHSERPGHRMYEQWHPLGVVGVISAFNFPVAVWSWNALLAMACGDVVVWKPSLKTPLTAVATQMIADRVLERHGWKGVLNLVIGKDDVVGERLIRDPRVPLISATGSTRMGRHVAQVVAGRLGRSLLELGGNNGLIVMDDADPDLVVRAVLFGAVGTAGQRCTSLRRLFLQKNIAPGIIEKLKAVYQQVGVGDPSDAATLMGPLIDTDAVAIMMRALDDMRVREALLHRIRAGVPFLGICLGLHALFETSEEAPEALGLGLFHGNIKRFQGDARVPHMGWNSLDRTRESRLLQGTGDAPFVYFANSFYAPAVPEASATCLYGVPFSAVIEHANISAVQFHPEKSGAVGLKIVSNFVCS